MSSIEIYKSTLGKGLKDFFEIYESSIKKLIEDLDLDKLLLKNFSEEQVNRLQELIHSSNMALKLSNDFKSVFDPSDEEKTKEKLNYLKKGFNTEENYRIGEHYHFVLVNTYIAFLERLKIYLLFFIDWNKLGIKHKKIHGISKAIEILKQKYPSNNYLNYFESGTRNSLTHYTFFWKHGNGGKIKLYSEIFDTNPKEMPLFRFMMEINELQVLSEGFYIMLRDKYNFPDLNLEEMEK